METIRLISVERLKQPLLFHWLNELIFRREGWDLGGVLLVGLV